MKSIFAVPTSHETSLPPMEDLQYIDPVTNQLTGGWWVVGRTPQTETTLICVHTTENMLEVMDEDINYLYVGDILETNG